MKNKYGYEVGDYALIVVDTHRYFKRGMSLSFVGMMAATALSGIRLKMVDCLQIGFLAIELLIMDKSNLAINMAGQLVIRVLSHLRHHSQQTLEMF